MVGSREVRTRQPRRRASPWPAFHCCVRELCQCGQDVLGRRSEGDGLWHGRRTWNIIRARASYPSRKASHEEGVYEMGSSTVGCWTKNRASSEMWNPQTHFGTIWWQFLASCDHRQNLDPLLQPWNKGAIKAVGGRWRKASCESRSRPFGGQGYDQSFGTAKGSSSSTIFSKEKQSMLKNTWPALTAFIKTFQGNDRVNCVTESYAGTPAWQRQTSRRQKNPNCLAGEELGALAPSTLQSSPDLAPNDYHLRSYSAPWKSHCAGGNLKTWTRSNQPSEAGFARLRKLGLQLDCINYQNAGTSVLKKTGVTSKKKAYTVSFYWFK